MRWIWGASAAGVTALPVVAHAHTGAGGAAWLTTDPWVVIPLTLIAAAYTYGVVRLGQRAGHRIRKPRILRTRTLLAAAAAFCTLFVALIWPLDALAEISFAAHMAQHMALIAVAAPLLVFAEPRIPLLHALPAAGRLLSSRSLRRLVRAALTPRFTFLLHTAVVWLWHAPRIHELGLVNDAFHIAGHFAFLGSALLFWTSLHQLGRAGGNGPGLAALWLLGIVMHMGLLGALITFAPRVLYPAYADRLPDSLTALEDQQLAGLVMWIPACVPYILAGLGFVLLWLRGAGRTAPRVG